ncbi:MAG: hypothetical protein AB7O65_09700 [Candidatus Korobacteraceae bacterium]
MLAVVLATAIILIIWEGYLFHRNRQRGREVVSWLKQVVRGHGEIVGIEWAGPESFRAGLDICSAVFRRAQVLVHLRPCLPVSWIWSRWGKREETLRFEADFHSPPGFALEVHNHRWRAPRGQRVSGSSWTEFRQIGPFVLTTRTDWQQEITSMLTSLVASRDCNFLSVRFSRTSPHFVATIPLEALSPECQTATEFFFVLRELASCGSASRS